MNDPMSNVIQRITHVEEATELFRPFKGIVQSNNIPLEKLPDNLNYALSELASSVLDPEETRTIVFGEPLAGKSFLIEQFVYHKDHFIKNSHLERMEFLSLNEFDVRELGTTEVLKERFDHYLAKEKLEAANVCFITESIDAAFFVSSALSQVKVLLEMNHDTFFHIMQTAALKGSRMWNHWQVVQVDKYSYSLQEIFNLLKATILPRLGERYKESLTALQLKKFLNFLAQEIPEVVFEADEDLYTAVAPGVWATCVKQLVSNMNHKRLPGYVNRQGKVIFDRIIDLTVHECEDYFTPYVENAHEVEAGDLPEELMQAFENAGIKPVVIRGDQLPEGLDPRMLMGSGSSGDKKKHKTPQEPLKFKAVDSLEDRLRTTIMGQDEAVSKVSNGIIVSAAGLNDPGRPLKSFLFLGPTGVGKTQMALDLAKEVADEDLKVIRLDMSEYQQEHEVAKLFGAPPGYMGFDQGGILTNAVEQNPHAVVLFDEIEKAHPKIFDALLQVLDAGHMTDSMGKVIDFTQTIIVMTSNLGVTEAQRKSTGFGTVNLSEAAATRKKDARAVIMQSLKHALRPEFINRIDEIVIFEELSPEVAKSIAAREVQVVTDRLESKGYSVEDAPEGVLDLILQKSDVSTYGAREIQRNVLRVLSEPLAHYIVRHSNDKKLVLGVAGGKLTVATPLEEK